MIKCLNRVEPIRRAIFRAGLALLHLLNLGDFRPKDIVRLPELALQEDILNILARQGLNGLPGDSCVSFGLLDLKIEQTAYDSNLISASDERLVEAPVGLGGLLGVVSRARAAESVTADSGHDDQDNDGDDDDSDVDSVHDSS